MIHLKNVSKVYSNGTEALKNVSLDIDAGEFVFVVGASGAGKSTFLKLLIHEEKATFGKIEVNGYDLIKIKSRKVPYLRRTMGIVFQDFRLIEKMNVYDNIAFAMRAIGAPEKLIKKRVKYVIAVVGLQGKEKCRPSELSGGEQQRVSLARALVNNPEMIIADEPTGNIDPKMSYEIMKRLVDINKKGTTVIIVTHDHDLVNLFGGRIITVDGGEIIEDKRISPKDEEEETLQQEYTDISAMNETENIDDDISSEKNAEGKAEA